MKRIILFTAMAMLLLNNPVAAQMENKMKGENQETVTKEMMTPGMKSGSQESTDKGMMGSDMMKGDMMGSGQQGMMAGGDTMMMPMRDMMPVMEMMKEMMGIQQSMMKGMDSMGQQENMKQLSNMMTKMDSMMAAMASKTQNETGKAAVSGEQNSETGKADQLYQEKAEAGVTVKITLEDRNSWRFKTVLDTHSVELDGYNFAEIVILRVNGTEYGATVISEEGSGHHRSAVLTFEAPQSEKAEMAVKSVAGVEERVFAFTLQ